MITISPLGTTLLATLTPEPKDVPASVVINGEGTPWNDEVGIVVGSVPQTGSIAMAPSVDGQVLSVTFPIPTEVRGVGLVG